MKEYLKKLPAEIQDLINLISKAASLRKWPVYLVGGFVRDLILGKDNCDLDIVVEGEAEVFAADLAAKLGGRYVRHHQFGTATVYKGHFKIDLATARREIYAQPASLPLVEFGTLQEDLKRRDFTINAMAISICQNNFGELKDFYQGRKDLKAKKIRVLHDLSFIDDPTRILRSIRFEQRFGFKLEPHTLKLLKAARLKGMLEITQPQRLREELILMFKEKQPLKQVKRLNQLAGLGFLNHKLKLTAKNKNLLKSVSQQIGWFNKVFPKRRKLDEWLIYLLAFLDCLDMNSTNEFCRKFVFRRGDEKRIFSAQNDIVNSAQGLSKPKVAPAKIFKTLEPLSYEVIILAKAKYRNRHLQKYIADFLEIYNGMRIYASGSDLRNLGLSPGPDYQKIFAEVLEAKLNGAVKTHEQEMELIKKMIRRDSHGQD